MARPAQSKDRTAPRLRIGRVHHLRAALRSLRGNG